VGWLAPALLRVPQNIEKKINNMCTTEYNFFNASYLTFEAGYRIAYIMSARILKDDSSPRAQMKARSPVQPLNIHGKSTLPTTESSGFPSLNKAKHIVSSIWQKHKLTLNSPISYSLK